MTDAFDVTELAAYPGVAAPPATIALVADIVNGLVEEMLDGRIPVRPTRVKQIALDAAAHQLINPEGAQTRTVQIDDYKETIILPDGAVQTRSGIGFDADQAAALYDAITGVRTPRAKSISLRVPGFASAGVSHARGWL